MQKELTLTKSREIGKNKFFKNEATTCCDRYYFRYKDTNRFNIKVLEKNAPLIVLKEQNNLY